MKPQHGTSPRDRSDRRARHQALERAEKQAERRHRHRPEPYRVLRDGEWTMTRRCSTCGDLLGDSRAA